MSSANAVTVSYEDPNISIEATDESLVRVLRSVAEVTGITVSMREDINPIVDCDIQNMPLSKALERTLRGLSYSFVWQDGGTELAGVMVMGSDGKTDKVMKFIVSSSAGSTGSQASRITVSAPEANELSGNALEYPSTDMEAEEKEEQEREEQERREHEEEMLLEEIEHRQMMERRAQEFKSEMEANEIEREMELEISRDLLDHDNDYR
jgi:hypothetical protein